jgi:hypothetical protein
MRASSILFLLVFGFGVLPPTILITWAHACPKGTFERREQTLKDDVLQYPAVDVVDFTSGEYTGFTMLYTQREIIKPLLDQFAAEGFQVESGDYVVSALELVAPKVRRKILSKHTPKQLKKIADELNAQGPISFLKMPAAIAKIDPKADKFNLPTYFALVSGGGVALRFAPGNYAYNVNYAIGKGSSKPGYDPKAIQTGRSFGQGPGERHGEAGTSGPNDVSDLTHLSGLQKLVQEDPEQGFAMTRTIIEATGASDFKSYSKLSPLAQTLTSDYFAVYTAEQIRNLMDDSLKTQSWDVSLMEVTLLSAFYSNLDEVWVLYGDDFLGVPMMYTNQVYNQYPKGDSWVLRDADFSDYWQRSGQKDPKSKDGRGTRSGINITRPQFRALGASITEWMQQNKPESVEPVSALLGSKGKNLYEELSSFFINERAPDQIGDLTYEIADAFVAFQRDVADNAAEIQKYLKKKYPAKKLTSEIEVGQETPKR